MTFKDIRELLVINGITLALIALLFAMGCGSGIGNPENGDPVYPANAPLPSPIPDSQFQAPIDEYNANNAPHEDQGLECGSFTELSPSGDVDVGRTCVRQAFIDCHPARYLLNQTLSNGSRFVSFVSVSIASPCQLSVHTVSSDSTRFLGDDAKSCSTLSFDEQIELACGIGQ